MPTKTQSPAENTPSNPDTPIDERLARLREHMRSAQIDAVIVPSSDPHLSEYLPEHWQARQLLSGFSGSTGTLIVAQARAALFVDSRYWTQAEQELGACAITVEKVSSVTPAVLSEWLKHQLPEGARVAVDGAVLAVQGFATLQAMLIPNKFNLHTATDFPGQIWSDRPSLPLEPVVEHLAPHATRTRADKLAELRKAMTCAKAERHLVSSLDDIAWILNLRGSDVPYNPVFLAHLLLAPDKAWLFVDAAKVAPALRQRLADDAVVLEPYERTLQQLGEYCADCTVLIDPARMTQRMRHALPASSRIIEQINPSTLLKSQKSEAELAHVRETMIEDGAAMCAFYAWFEQALASGRVNELDVDERLSAERAKRKNFVGLSFPTIAGFNANGAMPHYRATQQSHACIEGDGLLLIDSGAQYLGGTTDITRVWKIGTPSAAMKRDFTLVLKATMALSRIRFPRGTLSPMLDAIARAPLWAEGLDFGHGTGHGVGYFLNVHEGPQSLSRALPTPQMAMEPGMITSIEPGVYRPGRWGVRIENLVANRCVEDDPESGAFGAFLAFETLSLCPIDTRCIDRKLLRDDERHWVNAYHGMVWDRLSPHVEGEARQWLKSRTEPL